MIKSLPSSAEGAGSIPGWGAKIPYPSLLKKLKQKTEAILQQIQQTLKKC